MTRDERRATPRRKRGDVILGGLILAVATERLSLHEAVCALPAVPDAHLIRRHGHRRHLDRKQVRNG